MPLQLGGKLLQPHRLRQDGTIRREEPLSHLTRDGDGQSLVQFAEGLLSQGRVSVA